MTRSRRIRPVVKLARNSEHDAAVNLGLAQRRLSEAKLRLEELLRYREEYSQRFSHSGGQGLRGVDFAEYRMFLNRLNLAIEQQRHQIETIRIETEQQRQAWLGKHVRAEALGKVEERYRREEAHVEDKREQKEMDEYASRSKGPLK